MNRGYSQWDCRVRHDWATNTFTSWSVFCLRQNAILGIFLKLLWIFFFNLSFKKKHLLDVAWRTQELSKLQWSHIKVKDTGEATLGREESDGGEMLLPKVYLGRRCWGGGREKAQPCRRHLRGLCPVMGRREPQADNSNPNADQPRLIFPSFCETHILAFLYPSYFSLLVLWAMFL